VRLVAKFATEPCCDHQNNPDTLTGWIRIAPTLRPHLKSPDSAGFSEPILCCLIYTGNWFCCGGLSQICKAGCRKNTPPFGIRFVHNPRDVAGRSVVFWCRCARSFPTDFGATKEGLMVL